MSVVLNPSSSLGFNRPLTQHVKRSLAITNHNAQPVAFKVKTTAPKVLTHALVAALHYPNAQGCMVPAVLRTPEFWESGAWETVEVQVMLQAMKEEPPLNAKCKDKFLIQSTIITPDKETMPLQDLWTDNTEEVHSQKIRVVYLPPEGQTVPEEDEGMSTMLSESQVYGTVRQHFTGNGHAETIREPSGDSGVPHEEETHHDAPSTPPQQSVPHIREPSREEQHVSQEVPEEDVGIVNVNVHTPQPQPPPALSVPAPDPNAELVTKLHDAQAEIERLRHLISSMPEPSTAPTTLTTTPSELRRRRTLSPSDDTSTLDGETDVGTYMEEPLAPAEGVPLQVVIIIALAVFVTTYLFF